MVWSAARALGWTCVGARPTIHNEITQLLTNAIPYFL
jgi:hypothetical protein